MTLLLVLKKKPNIFALINQGYGDAIKKRRKRHEVEETEVIDEPFSLEISETLEQYAQVEEQANINSRIERLTELQQAALIDLRLKQAELAKKIIEYQEEETALLALLLH